MAWVRANSKYCSKESYKKGKGLALHMAPVMNFEITDKKWMKFHGQGCVTRTQPRNLASGFSLKSVDEI